MHLAIRLAVFAACFASAPAALAQSPWSSLRYQAPDGYVWDSRGGVWRSPRPVLDKTTGRREYLTRQPSSTACCDKTGLSFPMGSVNENIGEAAAAGRKPGESKSRQSVRAQLRERLRQQLARETNDTDSQIARVQGMEGASEEAKAKVIRDLESKRPGRSGRARPSEDAETGGGSASGLYGRLAGQSAGELEGTARSRRHDPSGDMTMGDVMGVVSGGLAAGAAIGGGIRSGQGYRSGQVIRSGPAAPTQGRRTPTPVPSGRGYSPYGSDISGTSN
jgi:hypothetical protein